MTVDEFLLKAQSMVDNPQYHYLYGYKGQTITHSLNIALRKQYPHIWTIQYLNKAEQWIGDKAIDCSGLITQSLSIPEQGSYYMSTHYKQCTPKRGCIAYRPGHVVIVKSVISTTQILILEASGQKTGLRERVASITEFKKYLEIPTLTYSINGYWIKQYDKWYYNDGNNNYLKNGYYKLKWSKGEDIFYFDEAGVCIITDENGVIKQ